MTDDEIIEAITNVRAANNRLWMKLLQIALAHAPDETKNVLRIITSNDRAISDFVARMAK